MTRIVNIEGFDPEQLGIQYGRELYNEMRDLTNEQIEHRMSSFIRTSKNHFLNSGLDEDDAILATEIAYAALLNELVRCETGMPENHDDDDEFLQMQAKDDVAAEDDDEDE